MKRLTKHIVSLLRLYDTVELPGIGFYNIDCLPASFDAAKGVFRAPRYEVRFDKDTDAAGSLLLESYIRKEGLGADRAREILESDLTEFRNYLDFGGNPVMEGLNAVETLLPDLALFEASVSADSVEKAGEKPRTVMEPVEPALPEEPTTITEELEEPAQRQGKVFNPDYYYIPIHKKLANIAASLLLVVIVGLAAVIPTGQSVVSKSAASIVPISVKDEPVSMEPKDTPVSNPAITENQESGDTAETEEEKLAGATSLPTSPFIDEKENDNVTRYYAVVAAFKSEKEANKFIDANEGNRQKFDIIKNRSFYMISVASSTQKEEFEANLPLIRSDYPDAWIYTMHANKK